MIVDFFYGLINGAMGGIPEVPPVPSWWPTTGIAIPLQGIASASVVGAVLVTYLAILLVSSGAYLARRVVSFFALGGGAL